MTSVCYWNFDNGIDSKGLGWGIGMCHLYFGNRVAFACEKKNPIDILTLSKTLTCSYVWHKNV